MDRLDSGNFSLTDSEEFDSQFHNSSESNSEDESLELESLPDVPFHSAAPDYLALTQDKPFLLTLHQAMQKALDKTRIRFQNSVFRVEITSKKYNYNTPWGSSKISSGNGSGFVVEFKGNVFFVTNAHVAENSVKLKIRFPDSSTLYDVDVICIDHDCDIALLKPKVDIDFIEPLTIGKPPKLRSLLTVVGFPMGGEEVCITEGTISRIEVSDYVHSGAQFLQIQHQAPQNPGNSGGPAVNESGELIGIAFQGIYGAAALEYIIPTQILTHFLEDFLQSGLYRGFPDIGINCQFFKNKFQIAKYLKDATDIGIMVTKIDPLCSSHGILMKNDIIVSIEGHEIKSDGSIKTDFCPRLNWTHYIYMHHIGDDLNLGVIRKDEYLELQIPLRNRVNTTKLCAIEEREKPPTYYFVNGVAFAPLTQNLLSYIDIAEIPDESETIAKKFKGQEAVVIISIFPTEYTEDLDGEHSIVTQVDGIEVRNFKHFVSLVESGIGEFVEMILKDESKLDIKRISPEENLRVLEEFGIKSLKSSDLDHPKLPEIGYPEFTDEIIPYDFSEDPEPKVKRTKITEFLL